MNLPFRRRSRPRGAARLAPVPDIPDSSEADTEQWLSQLRTEPGDGTTYSGANDIGVMAAPAATEPPAPWRPPGERFADPRTWRDAQPIAAIRAAGGRAWDIRQEQQRDTPPPAMLRTQPPPFSRAGYDATTGPMPAYGRPAVSIGDALTRDDQWGPKLAPLPCGHCGAPPRVPDGVLERTRIIGHVNWLAARDGWAFDTDLIWTCPDCQQGEAWKARQGQMEVWRDGYCDRHDLIPAAFPEDDFRCTCRGAVLAVDVMLASEDHLGSGRGRHQAGAR